MGRPDLRRSPNAGQPTDRLTVAEILKRSAGAYVAAYPQQAVPQVQSTLAKLSLCRTPALGGHKYRCSGCPHEVTVHNSCGDRYCPTCGGARRSNWLESTRELIFAGIDHFQVVFTLPAELSRLALGNRKLIYNLLFSSAWSATKQTIQSEHGFESAAVMVLHTWNQKLDAHAHVHAVVPGCGPASDGSGVRFAQRDGDQSTIGQYLVDAEQLRIAYREIFLRGLNRLRNQDLLKLTGEFDKYHDDQVWSELLAELEQTTWVSYIQPPPHAGASASQVMKYLARYLSGGPISDHRITSTDEHSVTLLARPGDVRGGHVKQDPITLSQLEFTRRWCLHILPKGYTRTRRFGGWSNTRSASYLERLAIQLESVEPALPLPETATEFGPWEDDAVDTADGQAEEGSQVPEKACPSCGHLLIPHGSTPKPSWANVMASPNRPTWYRRPG